MIENWTREDIALLLDLCGKQLPWPEVAHRLKRSASSCRNKYDRHRGPKCRVLGVSTVKDLTREQAAEAARLRNSGPGGRLCLRKIAKILGVSEIAVERVLAPHRLRGSHRKKQENRDSEKGMFGISVPETVLEERNRAYAAPVTITASLFGDPPPGRSALDRRAQWS